MICIRFVSSQHTIFGCRGKIDEALAEEVEHLPLAIKILGEELVLFRTRKGALGLVYEHCAHRGASWEFGVATDDGIRCCYHGWHFAPDGTILETPNRPKNSNHKKFCHGAYPVHEFKGIIFTYMGPPDAVSDFPMLDTYHEENSELVPYSLYYPCNWLQIAENTRNNNGSPATLKPSCRRDQLQSMKEKPG